jgi:hypothetical protein
MTLGTEIPDIVFVVTLTFALQIDLKKHKSQDKLKMFNDIMAVRNKEMGLMQVSKMSDVPS